MNEMPCTDVSAPLCSLFEGTVSAHLRLLEALDTDDDESAAQICALKQLPPSRAVRALLLLSHRGHDLRDLALGVPVGAAQHADALDSLLLTALLNKPLSMRVSLQSLPTTTPRCGTHARRLGDERPASENDDAGEELETCTEGTQYQGQQESPHEMAHNSQMGISHAPMSLRAWTAQMTPPGTQERRDMSEPVQ